MEDFYPCGFYRTRVRGFVDDQSVALVCSAALFEELAGGWAAGIEIIHHVFTMVLPGTHRCFFSSFLFFITVDISRVLYLFYVN